MRRTRLPSMLSKEQNGVSIWRKERPFLREASSTDGVEMSITTGVISSNSICPNGVISGSIVVIVLWIFTFGRLFAARRHCGVGESPHSLSSRSERDAEQIRSPPSKSDWDLGSNDQRNPHTVQSPQEVVFAFHDVVYQNPGKE